MSELEKGMLVKHASLGMGKIVALEPTAVHVFFPGGDRRFAAKLRLPAARPLLRTDGVEPDGWLEGLTAFTFDAAEGRWGLAATWLTHDQAVAQFLALFPEGFADPAYLARGEDQAQRAARWRDAHAAWGEAFGDGQGERLLADDDLEGLVERAREVDAVIAPLHPPADEGAVERALSEADAARGFFGALLKLLSVPSPGRARFEELFAAAAALPVEPAQQWLVATLFPFVAAPRRHLLLRPRVTCLAAERLGCDLRYQPSPNWATYSALRALGARLIERLAPNGATDFVDLESFLHVVASPRGQARTASTPRPRAARRAGTRSKT